MGKKGRGKSGVNDLLGTSRVRPCKARGGERDSLRTHIRRRGGGKQTGNSSVTKRKTTLSIPNQ